MDVRKLSVTETILYGWLLRYKRLKRKQFEKLTKIPRSTIYDNLEKLEKKKIVHREKENHEPTETNPYGRGGPYVFWCINEKELKVKKHARKI